MLEGTRASQCLYDEHNLFTERRHRSTRHTNGRPASWPRRQPQGPQNLWPAVHVRITSLNKQQEALLSANRAAMQTQHVLGPCGGQATRVLGRIPSCPLRPAPLSVAPCHFSQPVGAAHREEASSRQQRTLVVRAEAQGAAAQVCLGPGCFTVPPWALHVASTSTHMIAHAMGCLAAG